LLIPNWNEPMSSSRAFFWSAVSLPLATTLTFFFLAFFFFAFFLAAHAAESSPAEIAVTVAPAPSARTSR